MEQKQNLRIEVLECVECKKEFDRVSNNQKFCSSKCKSLYFSPTQNLSRKEINKRISQGRLKKLKDGSIKVWNKGLVKENSESLRSISEKNSVYMKNQYKNGKKNWSEGLTKETSVKVSIAAQKSIDKRKEKGFKEMGKKISSTRKKMFNEGSLNTWNKDLKIGPNNKLSTVRKRMFADNDLSIWNKNLTKETDERVKNGSVKIKAMQTDEFVRRRAEQISGDKCYNWKGGKSFEPYPSLFTEHFKQTVRKRDNFTCQICYIQYNKEIHKRRYPIHHIDGVKMNTTLNNSITLCKACHDLIHSGHNKIWIELIPNFQNKLHRVCGYIY